MQTVAIDTRLDGRLAVLVRPAAPGPWPGVVMVHEAWGLDDVLRRQAERLASAGFVVLAPDLFDDGPRLRCVRSVFRSLGARSGPPFALLQAARAQLLEDRRVNGRVGVIGFCMGGGFALLVAAEGFDASAVNYGMVPADVEEVLRGACPVVASYGGRDRQLVGEVPRLTAALEANDVPHDVQVYPRAGHSFLNDAPNGPRVLRPLLRLAHVGPEPEAAQDAWRRIEAFFGTHLAADMPGDPADATPAGT
ncbi:dienelactone hydrolase family protein [Microlunatus capsulatus]|uniref:Carboxymethylenebutenolidase n=1 Tax=Microlunatus capsulatus TaxID=99117 RepID=A0ABS4ZD32_9ACTN|nr:dienelactone hydrolase family protein [Microlunatus capsulatus]MBP2418632.1 carboxymethylenebutenolidase [Microlunatus capsulatus]